MEYHLTATPKDCWWCRQCFV